MELKKHRPEMPFEKARPTQFDVFTGPQLGMLNALRQIAMTCRASARADLFQACALLSVEKGIAREAHTKALILCLRQATGTRPIFYRPSEAQISFDEAWIMRAVVAAQTDDQHSFEFLLRSRIPLTHRRHIAFLLRGMAANLEV